MTKPFASLEKAIDILSLFDADHLEYTASEISKLSGMPLSTTYKYLDIFQKKGLFAKDSNTKKFYLGQTIYNLGILASEKITFKNVARPYMESLAEKTGETIVLTVVHGLKAICIDTVESARMIRLTQKRGSTLPLHSGATSKILLAFQQESFIEEIISNTPLEKLNKNTITTPRALKEELSSIRSKGYAFSESEVDAEAASISAPIFDHKGHIKAGITVSGPAERITGDKYAQLRDLVLESAEQISRELGFNRKS